MRKKRGASSSAAAEEDTLMVSQPSADPSSGAASALVKTRARQWRAAETGRRPDKDDPFARAMHDYQASASLFELGPSVALMDACIDDLLVRAGELEDREYRARAVRLCVSIRTRLEERNYAQGKKATARLMKYLEDGAEYDKCMARAVDYAERRNKLAKEARELACREAQTLTYRQAQELVANMFAVVREVLAEDTSTANLVISSVSRLMSAELGMSTKGGATREEAAEVVAQVRRDEDTMDV